MNFDFGSLIGSPFNESSPAPLDNRQISVISSLQSQLLEKAAELTEINRRLSLSLATESASKKIRHNGTTPVKR